MSKFDVPDPTKVSGLSTSYWSGHVDMAKAHDQGIAFVIIKFMDGKNIDPLADANYKSAMDAHLIVGGYSWLYNSQVVSPGGAARAFASFIKDHPTHIRPIVDFEWNRINPTAGDLDSFSIPFADAYGKRPMVYSAPGYTNQYNLPYKFASDPLWQAQYAQGKSSPMPPWLRYDFLQWSQNGDGGYYGYPVDGEKACELNYWRGTPQELLDFCDVKPYWVNPVPPPVPTPTPIPVPTPTPTDGVVIDEWWGKAHYQKYMINNGRDITYHKVTVNVADLADIVIDSRLNICETSTFLQKTQVDFAINGLDGFYSVRKGKNVYTYITGFSAWHGQAQGTFATEQTLFISQDMQFSLDKPKSIWSACSFPNLLIKNGAMQPLKNDNSIRARTALGISQDGKTLTILVVDGQDYFLKVGASFLDTANILLENKVWTGIMSDGGGSTTLVKRGSDGKPIVVNVPSGENSDGQRSVAVHCGFKLK